MSRSRERLGLLLGFFGMCLFAGTLPATRLAVTGFDPVFLTVARVTLAGGGGPPLPPLPPRPPAARVALAGCAARAALLLTRRPLPPRGLWGEMLAAASCTVFAFPLLAAFAMMTVPAAHRGVVFGILPLATTACAAIFTHERPSTGFWLASAAGALN